MRDDSAHSFYHIRGQSGVPALFLDDQDYAVFLNLLKCCLSSQPRRDISGKSYPLLVKKLDLICFCLMPSGFHLLVYQKEERAVRALMGSVLSNYGRHFNKKYGHGGKLLKSSPKVSRIRYLSYLEGMTRYIHLQPEKWRFYPYSSLAYYLNDKRTDWLRPGRVSRLFASRQDYLMYLDDG